jgi:hypothetical protein
LLFFFTPPYVSALKIALKLLFFASFATHFEGIRPFCREYGRLSQQLNKK